MNTKLSLSFGLGLSLALTGCLFEKEANRGSVVDNELRVGTLFLADGKPAVNARVRLFPVNHVPDSSSPAFSTRTDAKGRFEVDSVPSGEYNILGDLEGEYSYQDSVFISGSTGTIPDDTLDAPGSVTGVIGLQPGDDPRTITVQVIGTNSFSNVDASGHFRLAGLGAGKYAIRILTTLPEYTPLFSELRARAGRIDTLPDTLRVPFTGIPVVTGIKAVMDTVNGVARITWNPVDFPSFNSYFVYRDPVGTLDFANAPINTLRLTDTVYIDSLYRTSGDTLPRIWEYRLNVQNLNGKPGKVFNTAILAAVPPKTAQTQFKFKLLGTHGDSASIGDTIRVIATFDNPAYANKRISWTESGKPDILRTAGPDAKSGSDTLSWVAPDSAGVRMIRVQATDAASRTWRDSLGLTAILDRPSVNAGGDSAVSYGTPFTLHGKGTDGFGSIVKWEWRIGGIGEFAWTGSGDTTFILPMDADRAFFCILRITDDDGMTALDTVKLDIRTSRIVGRLATPQVLTRNLIVASYAVEGKIVSVLDSMGSLSLESFEPLSGKSTVFSKQVFKGTFSMTTMVDDKLYLMGDSFDTAGIKPTTYYMYSYDFNSEVWESEMTWEYSSNLPRATQIVGYGGKVYAFQQNGIIFEYSPEAKTWLKKLDTKINFWSMATCVGDGKIFVLKGDVFGTYDPILNSWQTLAKPLANQVSFYSPGLAWVGGRVYALGGGILVDGEDGVIDQVQEYDPAQNVWKFRSPLLHATGHPGAAVLGDKIYVVGASSRNENMPPTPPKGMNVLDFIEEYVP